MDCVTGDRESCYNASSDLLGWLVGCLMFYVPVNSYDHVGMVSSPNHTFVPEQA